MELALAVALVFLVFGYVILVRPRDLPPPEAVSPVAHLDEKKARIYEGLRDLQFEYRVGKLSDEDYQRTKLDLQKELAGVMAEIEAIVGKPAPKAAATVTAKAQAPTAAKPAAPVVVSQCPHCGAQFEIQLRFCGQCGRSMEIEA